MKVGSDPRVDALTEQIIGAAFAVSNDLGHGFLESVYRNALLEELRHRDLSATLERPFTIHYKGTVVGRYIADLVVSNLVIVELKAVECLTKAHQAQVLNYLKVSGLPIGLLFNFGRPRIEMQRIVLDQSV